MTALPDPGPDDGRTADDQESPPGGGSASMVDWGLAVATARRLSGPGPQVPPEEVVVLVEQLRDSAARAGAHVAAYTRLDGSAGSSPVLVVDRGGWAQANADALRDLTDPVMQRLLARRGGSPAGAGALGRVGPTLTGLEAGAMLAFLSGKVLGQFDPYHQAADERGRLLLVAPNILAAEQDLDVDPRDFRMWVCLHEETHRVQFTAVPWLRDHLRHEIEALLAATEIDPAELLRRVGRVLLGVIEVVRHAGGDSGPSLADMVQTPEQKAVLDRLVTVMSLLEGHADVVMDEVGPEVVPSVAKIRSQFQQRRDGHIGLDRIVRRLLGIEAKMRQYRDGAAFVRGVVALRGIDGFNRVWTSPDTLPLPEELGDPAAWVRRVEAGAGPAGG